jgi:hypothetical protein
MLARSRMLPLTADGLCGPLLIPSVSSKGFPLLNGLSEAALVLPLVVDDLAESLLISAYDIHHGLVIEHEKLMGPEQARTIYDKPALLVLDSGGYELSETFDVGERNTVPHRPRPFGPAEYELVVDRLSQDHSILAVTYDQPDDERSSYQEQLDAAQRFGASRPDLKLDFLLKPPAGDLFIVPARLEAEAYALAGFAAVGVTEKELGCTLLDRTECIARLRRLLDSSGAANIPLHVFGALDPVMTPMYFMAGAEIFDGLSWLRYAYHDDTAIHPDELAVLTGSLDADGLRRDAERYVRNLRQLTRLKERLMQWAVEPDRYELLGRHHERLHEVADVVHTRLGRDA